MSGVTDRRRLSRAGASRGMLCALALAACTGEFSPGMDQDPGPGPGGTTRGSGSATGTLPGTGVGGSGTIPGPSVPLPPPPPGKCATALPTRVTRLSDRHLGNAIRDLLGLASAPELNTGSGNHEEFLPNKPASVTGAVALKLRDVVEAAAGEATGTGKALVRCTTTEADCAREVIDRIGGRAFRRPVTAEERTKLLAVYAVGKDTYGGHAGGVRLALEAILQSPTFLYQTEVGTAVAQGRYRLTPFELAAKLSFFLRDSLPDDDLWKAAESGALNTKEGVAAQVDRLLQRPEVKANVTKMFARMVQVDRIDQISKAPTIKEWTPALAESMLKETHRFLDDLLWKNGAKLSELLTSRRAYVDRNLAPIYGVPAPSGTGLTEVTMPADQRAGILTQAAMMTIEAQPDQSSVVHRGVFVVRELLCFHPPPPAADDVAQGELFKTQEPTERGRALKRMGIARCAACHASFDPLGVTFENYDTLGRWRTKIRTPAGDVPVDASWDMDLADIKGRVNNAVELSKKLNESRAVKECMVRQFASYALGQRVTDAELCAIADASAGFEAAGGDLLKLLKAVATSDGLRDRREGEAP